MGIAGSYVSAVSMFLFSAVIVVPALLSLFLIGRGRVQATASNQPLMDGDVQDNTRTTLQGVKSVFLDRKLAIFAACVLLFFAASAAIGPGVAAQVTRRQPDIAALVVAETILLPQAIVATISPWIGRTAEISGRRPLLVVGWGLLPLQGFLYAAQPGPYALVLCNLLNAVSGAVFGVMMTVVAADLTRHTGGFNLVLGALGVAVSVGASLSTFFTGISAAAFGATAAALGLAMVGLCGLLLLWAAMPETRPSGGLIPTGVTGLR
jgi:hypothetical protein